MGAALAAFLMYEQIVDFVRTGRMNAVQFCDLAI